MHRCLWLLTWISLCGFFSMASAETPNVVFILVDDMGYGDPGCYNPDSKIPTPHINAIAEAGMRFTDAHSAGPLCHVSRYGLMTGRYPFRTNCGLWPKRPVIDEGRTTIASLMKSQGYYTAMVGKWHLGFAENGYDKPLSGGPVDRGFQSFYGIRASTDIPPYFYIRGDRAVTPPTDHIAANNTEGWSPIQGAFWREGGIAPDLDLKDVLPRLTDEAIKVIRLYRGNDPDQPLMLYLAYPAPHTPWLPAPEFDGKSGAGMYGDFMVMVDAMIGKVLSALDEAGMTDETLLVFSSDNGPTWYDIDVERFGHDSAGGLRGMKADAWEAGHRVPFIVRWPGRVEAGAVSDQLVDFTDVLATLADLTGAELADDDGPDSFSFLSTLLAEEAAPGVLRQTIVVPSGTGMQTIRTGPWKLITGLGSGGFSKPQKVEPGPDDPPGQLYNLAEDLAETTNLYLDEPEVVARLQTELTRIEASAHRR